MKVQVRTHATLHGWYSHSMSMYGTLIYSNFEGKEVEVTCVSFSPTESTVMWDDCTYVGPVNILLRKGIEPIVIDTRMFNEYGLKINHVYKRDSRK